MAQQQRVQSAINGEDTMDEQQTKSERRTRSGVHVPRMFTKPGHNPLDEVSWTYRSSTITNTDGSVVFHLDNAEVPEGWSQLATDIVVSKYFRKAGLFGDPNKGETSVRQVVERLAITIREAGENLGGYFSTKQDAEAFEAELSYLLVHQMGAFNSPVWFNCGLWHRYQIKGSGGTYAWNPTTNEYDLLDNAYERPQCSACFIQSVPDDLMGIYETLKTEAKLFKYGSGTGSNFSSLRGRQEKLSGGGTSSGLMSFLDVFDRAAGATKSGGTTRRAAKMVTIDMDHPEIIDFIEWKVKEEDKARALIAQGYSSDFNGEAFKTVSGQNSNNSVRITDDFMRAVEQDSTWDTIARTNGDVVDTYQARDLWNKVAKAAWTCADPGVQFDTTINDWHTCPNSGRINASNPCSEYMFLDNSACNLASLNLTKFAKSDGTIDLEKYRHAARVFVLAQEILVDFSSYPTSPITKTSHLFRTLGLGYANLGTLLMMQGLSYDSEEGRSVAAALTAILTGTAYEMSAEMAANKGTFERFDENRDAMLKVMNKHRQAALELDATHCPAYLRDTAISSWNRAVELGTHYGYRNAQVSVLAPTGTIGLLMDCDTTGIEPDFALVKFKKLAGGGYFKLINQSVPEALRRLGYTAHEVADIVSYVSGTGTFVAAPHINRASLANAGLTDGDIENAEKSIRSAMTLHQVFSASVIGQDTYKRLGVPKEKQNDYSFSLLKHLGFTTKQIQEASDVIMGRSMIEGAPHLRDEHLPVFDCANRCGRDGKRFLPPGAHVRMMAAVQKFLSGAISKTVNMPAESTVDDVREVYELAWRLGVKAVAIYRDGSKAAQVLSSADGESDSQDDDQNAKATVVTATSDKSPRRKHGGRISDEASAGHDVITVDAAAPDSEPAPSREQSHTKVLKKRTNKPSTPRVRLPKKRYGFTQEARVGGHKVFLRTGEYADGQLGEIFIDMHKEGAAFRSLMNCFSMSVSIGLQHGVPLETFVDQFSFTRFEPQGIVEGHPNIKNATSIVDYIFRVIGVEYLHRYDMAQVKPSPHKIEDPNDTSEYKRMTQTMDPPAPESDRQLDLPGSVGQDAPEIMDAHFEETVDIHEQTAADHQQSNQGPQDMLSQSLDDLMGDAPVCDQCGHITVRNGSCYRCMNCGNSLGCS